MISLDAYMENVSSIAIAGHVRPDGDCAGSCLAVYNYLRDQYADVQTDLYLEPLPEVFCFLKNADRIRAVSEPPKPFVYDLFIALDCGDAGRLGRAACYFETAKKTLCVDHHISNRSFADLNYIFPNASSTSELVYELLDREKITREIAECLYVGLVHDTGVFQYSCTSSKTMRIAGELMDKGIDYPRIVDQTFFMKTYPQNRILGRALADSELYLDGSCIYSVITGEDLEKYQAAPKDLDGIVSQLRSTEGVETAIFLYENGEGSWKVSLRSASFVDVAEIAVKYGGGGHCRAAGASLSGRPEEIRDRLLADIAAQQKQSAVKGTE